MAEDRKAVLAELNKTYRVIGETYSKEHWLKLAALPGWRDRLRELEVAFNAAWANGNECWGEFGRLRDHWREGLRAIKEQAHE